jgi:Fic family protein
LHPFVDGNEGLGRLLIVRYLLQQKVPTDPTLNIALWLERHRTKYMDLLLGVSTSNDWDSYVRFFAEGIEKSARLTQLQVEALIETQAELKQMIHAAGIRAETARILIDFAIGNPAFTVPQVQQALAVSYPRANKLVGQLVEIGVLDLLDQGAYRRRFFAPLVHQRMSQSTHPRRLAGLW